MFLTFIACYELIQLIIEHNNLANFETWSYYHPDFKYRKCLFSTCPYGKQDKDIFRRSPLSKDRFSIQEVVISQALPSWLTAEQRHHISTGRYARSH